MRRWARRRGLPPPAWPQVAPLALWSYALAEGADAAAAERIREAALAGADAVATRTGVHAYGISLRTDDYARGSNGVAANHGVMLLMADRLREDPRYREAALSNLHYLLGRNAFSVSWVTQVGAPVPQPAPPPQRRGPERRPWPVLLSGGPNRHRQDPALQQLPPELPPGRSWMDHQDSSAGNENAISWNAPLVFLLAGVSR